MPFGLLPGGGESNALVAPAGTRIPMQQASAPNGWTTDGSAAFTDCSMRINSGSGGSTGGSTSWSSWNFGGTFNVNTFALGVGNIPSHNHGINDPTHNHGVSDPGHQHALGFAYCYLGGGGDLSGNGGTNVHYANNLSAGATTSISVQANFAGITTANTGSGTGLTPNYTTPQVKYADHIIAVKS